MRASSAASREQAALGAATTLPRETRSLIEKFLAIAGDPDEAAVELRSLAASAGLKNQADNLHAAADNVSAAADAKADAINKNAQ